MPEVKKQKPTPPKSTTPSTAARTKTGTLLDDAVDATDLPDGHVSVVIYGQNRVGKTTLACQFPKPLLLVDVEPTAAGGSRSIKGQAGIKVLNLSGLKTTDKLVRLGRELKEHCPFKTVVVDSATSVQDLVLQEILGLDKLPEMLNWGLATLKDYQKRSEKTREILRLFLDLPCDKVITAKEKDHNPPKEGKPEIVQGVQQESFFSVGLGGETAGWLQDTCTGICQLVIQKELAEQEYEVNGKTKKRMAETGKNIRRLRLKYHPNYAAGVRSPKPDEVPEFIDNPTYDKLRAVLYDE